MKKAFFSILLFLFSSAIINAQSLKETFYKLDRNWQGTDGPGVKYYVRIRQLNDTTWVRDYYNYNGPKIKQCTYQDENGKVPNGFFAFYNAKGLLDSCGQQGVAGQQGEWVYFNGDSSKYSGKKLFVNGVLKETISVGAANDTGKVLYVVEKEAEFNGGNPAKIKFLNKNLRYPQDAIDNGIMGTMWVLFIVDQQGKISEPIIQKSVEYSIDQEGLRIIQLSPNWIPASQSGRNVASYKSFAMTWRLETN